MYLVTFWINNLTQHKLSVSSAFQLYLFRVYTIGILYQAFQVPVWSTFWANNLESVFQASDTISRAPSLSQIVTNLLDLLTWLELWQWTGKYISGNFETLNKIELKLFYFYFLCCVFCCWKYKNLNWYIEKLQRIV